MVSKLAFGHRTHFFGICVIALCVLAFQVLLTRLFSVMLYYHFAFVGISLAMLGLTIGAQKVYLYKDRFSSERLETEWIKAALGFGASSVILTLAFLYIPLVVSSGALVLVQVALFIIPFTYGGICVTLLLTKSAAPVGRLYAADLAGASLGCIGIVAILFLLDPISIIFGLASLAALAAWLMARDAKQPVRLPRGLAFVWLALFVAHGALYITHQPHFGVVWAKGHETKNILFERWNAFSLVRVGPGSNTPFGWGFGHIPKERGPDQLGLGIDEQAGTAISHFDGKDLKPFWYLADDVINVGYHVRPIGSAAIIGVGGGRDILSALYFGVPHVVGVELNPSIFEALTSRFGDFSGHLDRRPDVSLHNAEARSWLNHSDQSFDLIQISLIDTWAATAASGLALSENKLYTVDAWKDFMNRLTPKGVLTVSRWFDPVEYKGEFYRLLAVATEALEQRGVPPVEVKQHILAFSVDNHGGPSNLTAGVITVVTSPSAFTAEEVANARVTAEKYGFQLMVTPDMSWDDVSRTIVSGAADKNFYDALPIDVSAPTDNRPFFFHMIRLKDIISGRGVIRGALGPLTTNNFAMQIVFCLLIGTVLSMLYFMIIPFAETWRQIPDKRGMVPYLGYFSGIGLGFMLIEISQMQRLMIFLGHPVYGLTVVLFTLLLFGGIGSATVTPAKIRHLPLWLRPVILCLVLGAVGVVTPCITEQVKGSGTAVRIVASVLLLAPAGFCMGMMFPLGMAASDRYRMLQSWFWGVNGAASVFGSVLGVVISMECGISAAFWTGVACYALCALLMYRESRVTTVRLEV